MGGQGKLKSAPKRASVQRRDDGNAKGCEPAQLRLEALDEGVTGLWALASQFEDLGDVPAGNELALGRRLDDAGDRVYVRIEPSQNVVEHGREGVHHCLDGRALHVVGHTGLGRASCVEGVCTYV